jgi:TRAP-type C4-dicarboxylate transport system permease small subunit
VGFARNLDRFCERLNRATELVIAVLLALTVMVALLQVVFRYGLDSSLSWSEELARYLFIWVIFIGMASAARRGQHMAVEALAGVLPGPALRPLAVLVAIISIVFFGVVFYTGVLLTENAIHQQSTALEISVAFVYVSAPIGAALTIGHLVNGLMQILAGDAPLGHTATDIS